MWLRIHSWATCADKVIAGLTMFIVPITSMNFLYGIYLISILVTFCTLSSTVSPVGLTAIAGFIHNMEDTLHVISPPSGPLSGAFVMGCIEGFLCHSLRAWKSAYTDKRPS
jgi:hypothetical protein